MCMRAEDVARFVHACGGPRAPIYRGSQRRGMGKDARNFPTRTLGTNGTIASHPTVSFPAWLHFHVLRAEDVARSGPRAVPARSGVDRARALEVLKPVR
jgi:hypothetical protein